MDAWQDGQDHCKVKFLKMGREVNNLLQAENLLRGPEVGQGAFLMRESQSHKGDFTLTIKNGSRIAHCRIVRNYRGWA